jgi:periplasmic divalent cation tolerance protein
MQKIMLRLSQALVHWQRRSRMPEKYPAARIVLTTINNIEEASRIGNILVEERLVACATVFPSVQSIYHWQDKMESTPEALLLLKTGSEQIAALEIRLLDLHHYQTPEFLVLSVESANAAYLQWLHSSLRTP